MTTTFERLGAILSKEFKLAPERLAPDTPLEDLGIDSRGTVELLWHVEEAFAIKLPPEPVELATLATIDTDAPSASYRPFSGDRSGMVLGEGAAMLVLEPWDRAIARGAMVYGEILGYGLANDASHITRPSADGQAAAMRAALRSASLVPAAVDAINAHGTGTQANDRTETAAIRAVFGTDAMRIPVSATKAIHGHLLGAAGALECVLSLLAMQHAVALPTMHLQTADPECDLDYVPNRVRDGVAARTMLSNSFGFGGMNAVLALGAGTACRDHGPTLQRA